MNKITLLAGAVTLFALSILTEEKSLYSASLVLLWIGLAVVKKGD